MRAVMLMLAAVAAIAAPFPTDDASGSAGTDRVGRPTPPREVVAPAATNRLPLHFEENVGQHHPVAKFLARGRGFRAWFADGEVVLDARAGDEVRDVLRMRFSGSDVVPQGGALLPGKSNYFLGNDASKWVTDAPHRADVTYTGVAPGVDVTWRSSAGSQLEYVLTAAPGADAESFVIEFDGAESLEVTRYGDLVVATPHGDVRHGRPVAWQETGTGRRAVECRFDVRGERCVGFRVGKHDPARQLVVDPTIVWATKYGGTYGSTAGPNIPGDCAAKVAVDSAGAAYVAGTTKSSDFPCVNALQSGHGGGTWDGFVFKIDSAGTSVAYSTYFGGSGREISTAIAVDANGAAYVVGETMSSNFPTQSAYQSTSSGGRTMRSY